MGHALSRSTALAQSRNDETQNLTVTLAFDEGPGVGLGHRRRMEALAHELESRGFRCPMVPLGDSAMVAGRIAVIDSYKTRGDDPGRVRAGTVVALDDLRRDLAVHLVIDPSPGADVNLHTRAGRVLAGAAYALLSISATETAPITKTVERVLVTTGASDTAGAGARMAADVAAALPDAEVRLVVGPWGSPDVPNGVVAVHERGGLDRELAQAALVVTAGGVALLEACALGRPTIGVVLAENQRQAVDGLTAMGAIVAAGPSTIGGAVRALADDLRRRTDLGRRARAAIDGNGPARVATAIEQLVIP